MLFNKLNKWLRQHNFFLFKNETGRPTTHLCLDGGRLSIPEERHAEFMDVYMNCFTDDDEKYYICEVPTSVSRMYVDMDIVDSNEMTDQNVIDMVDTIQESVLPFFGEKDIIICRSENTVLDKNGVTYNKCGVHLIWPDLYVTNTTADKLSKIFVKALEDTFGKRPDHNPWNDVIDSNVYNKKLPSLRMVGSGKLKRDNNNNVHNIGRAYLPSVVVRYGNDNIVVDKANMDKYIKLSFIRVFEAETDALCDIPDIKPFSIIKSIKKNYTMERVDELCTVVEEFIVGCGIPQWEDVNVRSVVKEKTFYTVKVSDTMYCLNKQAEHGRCGIYFVLFQSGMRQKCFCRCDTTEGRVDGRCAEYSSKYFKYNSKIVNKLFPKSKENKGDSSQYNPGNSFPPFHLLDSNPVRFSTMLENTVRYYDAKKSESIRS
jgi:hypothetical protein